VRTARRRHLNSEQGAARALHLRARRDECRPGPGESAAASEESEGEHFRRLRVRKCRTRKELARDASENLSDIVFSSIVERKADERLRNGIHEYRTRNVSVSL
jgi:hypothetical protein